MPTLLYGVERTMYFFNHFYPMGRPISVAIVTPCANEPMWPYTIYKLSHCFQLINSHVLVTVHDECCSAGSDTLFEGTETVMLCSIGF
jgi:hypothetical protein